MAETNPDYTVYLNLIASAKEAAAKYYETDEELMSDSEYDLLIENIEFFEHKYGWNQSEGLLTAVAGGVSDGGDVKHDHRMLSLGKVKALDEVTAFVNGMERKLGSTVEVVLEPKLDGLAISAKYVDGKLVQVVTRGNGYAGEDITARVLPYTIKGLPKEIPYTEAKVEVRGEVYITKSDFQVANLNRVKFELAKWAAKNAYSPLKKEDAIALVDYVKSERKNEEPVISGKIDFKPSKYIFANSRNAVSGSLRRETVDYVVPMSFAAYDSFFDGHSSMGHRQQQELVRKLGFTSATALISPEIHALPLVEGIAKFGEIRAEQEYPTDGVVIKADKASVRVKLGQGSKNPRWAVAYKYPSVLSETVVKDIELNIGRTGRLTLRAKVAPVLVNGTLITYASLHNVSWLEEKDIRIGDTVTIKRANDVIPYIAEAVLIKRPATAVKWVAPEVCFQCGEKWDKSTLLWRCDSDECGKLNTIIHAAGRDYFDWEGLSEAIITRLNDMGLVNDIGDVFLLSKETLETLDMGRVNKDGEVIVLGEKTADKLYKKIQGSKTRPLNAVLASLGVRTLGRSVGRWLADAYPHMDSIFEATPASLARIEGIGETKANLIHEGLQSKKDLIVKLGAAGVNMAAVKREPVRNVAPARGGIAGMRICVTGSVPGYTRSGVADLLRAHGATSASSVSGTTDLLVAEAGAENNSKYQAAVRLRKTIITPEAFLRMVNG